MNGGTSKEKEGMTTNDGCQCGSESQCSPESSKCSLHIREAAPLPSAEAIAPISSTSTHLETSKCSVCDQEGCECGPSCQCTPQSRCTPPTHQETHPVLVYHTDQEILSDMQKRADDEKQMRKLAIQAREAQK